MVDKIEKTGSHHLPSSLTVGKEHEKKISTATDEDVSLFKKLMSGKEKEEEKKSGGKMSESGKVGSGEDHASYLEKKAAKEGSEKQLFETHGIEKEVKTKAFETLVKTDDNTKKDQNKQGLQENLALKSGQAHTESQHTILKQNLVHQAVKKATAEDVKSQQIVGQLDQRKKVDPKVGESDVSLAALQSHAGQTQFSAEMNVAGASQASPVNREALMAQINKIADYIQMQANDMGQTESITIKFKDDILPGTSLVINRAEDGGFDLNFKSENSDSLKLITENQNSLLESLNNNTQGARFRVKLDKE